MALTKVQRNRVFQAIVDGHLDPVECGFADGPTRTRIDHRSSGSYFDFSGDGSYYSGEWMVVGDGRHDSFVNLNSMYFWPLISHWAGLVSEDAQTADLWSDIQRQGELLSSVRNERSGNTPFTPDEQRQIADKLREIQTYIVKNYDLSAEQISHIDDMLKEAADAGSRIGRKDWILLFTGTMSSLIVTDLLPPQAAQHALITVLQGLAHIFGVGGPPILPPA